jgi:hypothetical protein
MLMLRSQGVTWTARSSMATMRQDRVRARRVAQAAFPDEFLVQLAEVRAAVRELERERAAVRDDPAAPVQEGNAPLRAGAFLPRRGRALRSRHYGPPLRRRPTPRRRPRLRPRLRHRVGPFERGLRASNGSRVAAAEHGDHAVEVFAGKSTERFGAEKNR